MNERIKNLLLVTDRETRLPTIIDEILKIRDRKWYEDKMAFGVILNIRNEIAHGYYLPEIGELKKNFGHIYANANKKLVLVIDKYLPQIPEVQSFIQKYMSRSFETISSDLEFMMFLIELGIACLRYLSVIEKIMIRYYGKTTLHKKLIRKIKKKFNTFKRKNSLEE